MIRFLTRELRDTATRIAGPSAVRILDSVIERLEDSADITDDHVHASPHLPHYRRARDAVLDRHAQLEAGGPHTPGSLATRLDLARRIIAGGPVIYRVAIGPSPRPDRFVAVRTPDDAPVLAMVRCGFYPDGFPDEVAP